MKLEFELLKTEENTKARLGKIKYHGKEYETPMFMPVGTLATVKTLSPEEVKEEGSTTTKRARKTTKTATKRTTVKKIATKKKTAKTTTKETNKKSTGKKKE